jgi:hypothetical protein
MTGSHEVVSSFRETTGSEGSGGGGVDDGPPLDALEEQARKLRRVADSPFPLTRQLALLAIPDAPTGTPHSQHVSRARTPVIDCQAGMVELGSPAAPASVDGEWAATQPVQMPDRHTQQYPGYRTPMSSTRTLTQSRFFADDDSRVSGALSIPLPGPARAELHDDVENMFGRRQRPLSPLAGAAATPPMDGGRELDDRRDGAGRSSATFFPPLPLSADGSSGRDSASLTPAHTQRLHSWSRPAARDSSASLMPSALLHADSGFSGGLPSANASAATLPGSRHPFALPLSPGSRGVIRRRDDASASASASSAATSLAGSTTASPANTLSRLHQHRHTIAHELPASTSSHTRTLALPPSLVLPGAASASPGPQHRASQLGMDSAASAPNIHHTTSLPAAVTRLSAASRSHAALPQARAPRQPCSPGSLSPHVANSHSPLFKPGAFATRAAGKASVTELCTSLLTRAHAPTPQPILRALTVSHAAASTSFTGLGGGLLDGNSSDWSSSAADLADCTSDASAHTLDDARYAADYAADYNLLRRSTASPTPAWQLAQEAAQRQAARQSLPGAALAWTQTPDARAGDGGPPMGRRHSMARPVAPPDPGDGDGDGSDAGRLARSQTFTMGASEDTAAQPDAPPAGPLVMFRHALGTCVRTPLRLPTGPHPPALVDALHYLALGASVRPDGRAPVARLLHDAAQTLGARARFSPDAVLSSSTIWPAPAAPGTPREAGLLQNLVLACPDGLLSVDRIAQAVQMPGGDDFRCVDLTDLFLRDVLPALAAAAHEADTNPPQGLPAWVAAAPGGELALRAGHSLPGQPVTSADEFHRQARVAREVFLHNIPLCRLLAPRSP